ncbi:hypothetical protein L6164_014200 [Bauhinia variegata]|uniref:Uncharacterized protein n=1 Tax=Bauhinia variegata TaxID=167791 RepID=A0ACB9NGS2_BAUVA|nr:hypothetical protein L6164_014200 [Bauhinia variegata]
MELQSVTFDGTLLRWIRTEANQNGVIKDKEACSVLMVVVSILNLAQILVLTVFYDLFSVLLTNVDSENHPSKRYLIGKLFSYQVKKLNMGRFCCFHFWGDMPLFTLNIKGFKVRNFPIQKFFGVSRQRIASSVCSTFIPLIPALFWISRS